MPQRSLSVYPLGEFLLQFPDFALLLYRFWLPSGLPDDFDEDRFFNTLIESEAYHHQPLSHSYKGEHGPLRRLRDTSGALRAPQP